MVDLETTQCVGKVSIFNRIDCCSKSVCFVLRYYLSQAFKFAIRRRSDYIIGFIAPAIGPNKSKKLTRLTELAHNIHGKVWMKNNIHGFTDRELSSVKPCILFFIQTLPRTLCVGAISVWVSWICLDRLPGQ